MSAKTDNSTTDAQSTHDYDGRASFHGRSKFLWEVPADTPLDELEELYQRWNDDSEHVDLGRWSE